MFRSILIVVLGGLLAVSGCARTNHAKAKIKSAPAKEVAAARDEAPLADMNADVAAYVDPARANKSFKSPSAAITLNDMPVVSTNRNRSEAIGAEPRTARAADGDVSEVLAIMDSGKPAKRNFSNEDVVSIGKSKTIQQPTIDLDTASVAPLTHTAPLIPAPSRTTKPINGPRLYTFGPTKPGTNLTEIAEVLLPSEEVSVSQMMWALYKKNPEAFVKQHINNIKSNTVLNVPEVDEVMAISRKEADAQIARLRGTGSNGKTKVSAIY